MTETTYTAADFEAARLAEHPDGRTAARLSAANLWHMSTADGTPGLSLGSKRLVDGGFVPVSLARVRELEAEVAAKDRIAEAAQVLATERTAANGVLETAVKLLQQQVDGLEAQLADARSSPVTLAALQEAWTRADEISPDRLPRKGDTVIHSQLLTVEVSEVEQDWEPCDAWDRRVRVLHRATRPDGAEAIEAALIDLTGDARAAALEEISEGQDDLAADRIAECLDALGYKIINTDEWGEGDE